MMVGTGRLPGSAVYVNGERIDLDSYIRFHGRRIEVTLAKLAAMGSRKILEVGGHPWAMTARLIDDPRFEVVATVSAEEATRWPDDIGVSTQRYQITSFSGRQFELMNYSANIERALFTIDLQPDTVLACEIIEHLIRAPHVMLLNFNSWLPLGGKVLLTTPNGLQFNNPFRRKPPAPAYRCNVYERHHYLYSLPDLVELVEQCGFAVVEAGYWDVYRREGWTQVYDLLGSLPWSYFRDKFKKTIYVVADKQREVRQLDRPPRVYDPRGDWEFIAKGAGP